MEKLTISDACSLRKYIIEKIEILEEELEDIWLSKYKNTKEKQKDYSYVEKQIEIYRGKLGRLEIFIFPHVEEI